MNAKTNLTLLLLAAAGTAMSVPTTTLGAAKVVNISGATLLENFVKAPGTTNDFADIDGDGIAGSLGSFVPDQLAPFDATLNYNGADEIWVVQYSAVGSVAGVQELVDFGRPFLDTSDATDIPGPNNDLEVAQRALAYHNRTLYINGGASSNAIFNALNPHGAPVRATPTYDFTNNTSAPDGIQIDIAPTDVPTAYTVTKPGGVPGPELNPFELGYGLNPKPSNNKTTGADDGAAQTLATLTGSRNINEPDNGSFVPNSDTIYDTPISYSPIGIFTNLGVGKTQVSTTELRHAYVTGRLPSGQNIVVMTRESGSGTRNGAMNSIGIDPSWGSGDNVGLNNTGNDSANNSPHLVGPEYIPTNKIGSSDIDRALRNTRLGISYSGAERAVGFVSAGRAELLAVRNDHKAGNIGTQYSRPTFADVSDNTVDGYRIGGFSVLASLGDPKAETVADFGLNNGEEKMSNKAAADYLNNVRLSIESFVSVPASPDNELMPAEAIVKILLLPDALTHTAILADPDAWTTQTQNTSVASAIQSLSVLATNPLFATFGTAGLSGQSPRRSTAVTYTDNNTGSFYVLQDGTTLNYNTQLTGLTERNRIAGDANGDGLRDIADIEQLVNAFQSTAPQVGVPGSWAAPNGIYGAGAGNKASREILFDFNCDGNFTLLDVRYFADGLATEVTGSNNAEGNLNRKQAFIDVDSGAVGGNLFGTTLANGTYDAGDSRADVAGAALSAGTAPGWAPIGADGTVNGFDIDYVYGNFGDWSDLNDAAFMDLSCDMTGDLIVDQADICEILAILETSIGDVNLDGTADAADLVIATANVGQVGVGFAGGDVNGDGTVDQADLDLISGVAASPCVVAPACVGDINGDGSTNAGDFVILAGNFGAGPGATAAQGDLNGDGFVNASDFVILAGDFGCN